MYTIICEIYICGNWEHEHFIEQRQRLHQINIELVSSAAAVVTHSLLRARPRHQVHEAHPPPLHPRLQLFPVGEGVGELTEPHAQGAELV